MKHSPVGLTPRQALLINAIGRQIERDLTHNEVIVLAARETGLSVPEAIQVLDSVIADTDEQM